MFTTRNNPSSFEEHETDPELSRADQPIEDLEAPKAAQSDIPGGFWAGVKDHVIEGASGPAVLTLCADKYGGEHSCLR